MTKREVVEGILLNDMTRSHWDFHLTAGAGIPLSNRNHLSHGGWAVLFGL